jgi:hypothetical protein
MNTQPNFDFSNVPDEEFERNDHAADNYKRTFLSDAEHQAWCKERRLRQERKQAEQERFEQERAAEVLAAKNAIQFNETIASEICERISSGEFLINVCHDAHTPTMRNVTQWLKQHSDFKALYDDAINDRLNIFEDEVVTISDDSKQDFKIVVKNGKERRVYDSEVIARAKLRVDVRFRHLKAYRPARWGEQSTLNLKSEDNCDPSNMSEEELERSIADLETKSRTVKAA